MTMARQAPSAGRLSKEALHECGGPHTRGEDRPGEPDAGNIAFRRSTQTTSVERNVPRPRNIRTSGSGAKRVPYYAHTLD
jgi:hypothetical protein